MRTSYPVARGNKHPTPHNFRIEHHPGFDVAFSYRTPIGVRRPGEGWIVRENWWGNTTSRHMAVLWPRIGDEFTGGSFVRILNAIWNGEKVEVY